MNETMNNTDRRFSIVIAPAGLRFDVLPTQSLLQAAAASGIALPASCRNGTCRTCICRLHSGQVHHGIEWPGLSADEKRDGYILPCVAFAESDLVLDVPRAHIIRQK
jgi:ferredoxin